MAVELPELLVPDGPAWRTWLSENHQQSQGVRLVLGKKGGSVTELVYDPALRHALCFGWIDGQVTTRDEGSYAQRFTPRTARSRWSARNVGLVGELTAAGLMEAAGLEAVAAARSDGRWDSAYAGSRTAVVPADLAAAIEASPAAAAFFPSLSSQNRYAILYRVEEAKRPETRARRIAAFVQMLEQGETVHPQKRP
ncbi:YdeI/OmpD-associated family protein [Jatrophihabitans telluris]|uniref:YdeI/OmpD-associated family protein n=1 Tax=Jatrophihabitans telluris TaxID=2038343 RepID=A0ABY4R264_9ACTN|nr:YdeI/OmpD-associated family protein [Jatrophihabitans telluris]UQX89376.1 YdeI/OmpD-associated family protein [Jatrophihabitans telluris]